MLNSALQAGERLAGILSRIEAASALAGHGPAQLLAVSKLQSATRIAELYEAGQRRFGENYVQEALTKQEALADRQIEWHLIGPLQSNKARLAAGRFDWIHSVDRAKLLPLLAEGRSTEQAPLNVLIQVNIDDEQTKSGCRPLNIDALAEAISTQRRLVLRGLMAIPAPHTEVARRQAAFHRMHSLFKALQQYVSTVDTLSMGMSDDFEQAIAEGATLVRVGTALFGPRPDATST